MKNFSGETGLDILASTALLDLIYDLVFLMEEDHETFRYIYANPAACEILNLEENFIGSRIEDVTPLEQAQVLIQNYREVQSKQKPVEFIHRFETETGPRIGETVLNPILTEAGHCQYILAIVRDITERERAQEASIEAKEELEIFRENSTDPVFFIDTKGEIKKVNPAFEDTFQYSEKEVLTSKISIVPHELKFDTFTLLERIMKGETMSSHETVRITKSGNLLNIIASYTPVRNANKEIIGSTIFYKDVTKLKKAEKELQKSQEKYKLITESAFDVITLISPSGLIEYVSPSNEKLLGYADAAYIGNSFTTNVHTEDAFGLIETAMSLLNGQTPAPVEVRFLHQKGHWIWMEVSLTPVVTNGKVNQILTIAREIMERKQLQDKIAKMAFYDHLSGIPNRRTFDNRLQTALHQANQSGKKVGVLLLDGRKFKKINDQFGHDAGDAVIKEMAVRLQACVRPTDTAARLGGDEMGVVLPELDSLEVAEEMAKRILHCFGGSFTFNGKEIKMGAGIGISLYPDDTDNEKQLIKYADMALYEAKKADQDTYIVYGRT